MAALESNGYQHLVEEIAGRASAMKKTLVDPFRDENGAIPLPTGRAASQKRDQILESAIKGTVYEAAPHGKMIAGVHSRVLQNYERVHGRLPADDLLASCSRAVENAINLGNGIVRGTGIFETAEMSTTEGILMRDRLISLVLPVHLQMITAAMVTFMPGDFNQSEFFRITRIAGSTFGDMRKGDVIDADYKGVYSCMDQRVPLGTGDGSTTSFTFDSQTTFGVPYPMRPKRARVYVNHELVAEDNGNGALAGKFQQGGSFVVVSGTVNYASGNIAVTFASAPVDGAVMHVGFDVNIEKDPTLIPRVDHQMESRTLYPHESAIAGNATIQAIWALRRELGQDLDNMNMQALRNLLAADKDKKHLNDMLFHAQDTITWKRVGDPSLTLREHYESLLAALLAVDSHLMLNNKVSGLVGIVAGTNACNLFRYLPAPYFVPAPGYRSIAQPHHVGRVFGQFDLYCNPYQDTWTSLCYAKGPDHGQTAYVVGDAVPALTFRHPVMGDLVQKATMWDLAYRDMQPFDGTKYLCKLVMTEN